VLTYDNLSSGGGFEPHSGLGDGMKAVAGSTGWNSHRGAPV
jgi:hypothetical protein